MNLLALALDLENKWSQKRSMPTEFGFPLLILLTVAQPPRIRFFLQSLLFSIMMQASCSVYVFNQNEFILLARWGRPARSSGWLQIYN